MFYYCWLWLSCHWYCFRCCCCCCSCCFLPFPSFPFISFLFFVSFSAIFPFSFFFLFFYYDFPWRLFFVSLLCFLALAPLVFVSLSCSLSFLYCCPCFCCSCLWFCSHSSFLFFCFIHLNFLSRCSWSSSSFLFISCLLLFLFYAVATNNFLHLISIIACHSLSIHVHQRFHFTPFILLILSSSPSLSSVVSFHAHCSLPRPWLGSSPLTLRPNLIHFGNLPSPITRTMIVLCVKAIAFWCCLQEDWEECALIILF